MLTNILSAVEGVGEQTIASDVRQLMGLCDREDSEAFLPLQSEELTSGIVPRRLNQFCDLVDDLTSRLTGSGIGDTNGLRSTSGKAHYGRYLRIHGVPGLLCFNAQMWASKYPTPIWLRVYGYGPDWKPDTKIMEHLSKVELTAGIPSFRTAEGMNFPIVLPTGVERAQVVKEAEEQLLNYAGLLKEVAPVCSVSDAPVLPPDLDQS